MLLSGVMMMALAVASSSAWKIRDLQGTDRLTDLLEAYLGYVERMLVKNDPSRVPDTKFNSRNSLFGGLIKADGALTHTTETGMADFRSRIIWADPEHLMAVMVMGFPEISIRGDYKINGLAFGKKVNGHGQFELDVFAYVGACTNLEMYETEQKALRIKSLGLKLFIKGFDFGVNGLKVKDMTEKDFEELVDQTLSELWMEKKYLIARQLEAATINSMNKAIGNRTLEEVTQWLREHSGEDNDVPVFASLVHQSLESLRSEQLLQQFHRQLETVYFKKLNKPLAGDFWDYLSSRD